MVIKGRVITLGVAIIYQEQISQESVMEDFFNTLKKQYYVQVPFPIERGILEEAMEAFFKFLKEPDTVKNHIDFTIAPKHRRGDVGFKHRDAENHLYDDSKDFFHFHPAIFEKYEAFLKEQPIVHDFMLKAQPIWDLAHQTTRQILQSFDQKFPGTSDKIFDSKTEYVHLQIRFLKYDWQESGKYLAKPHFDAGSFTLAIAESCPGLRIGSCPDDLQVVVHEDQHALFILSSNFKRILDTDDLLAGWHDVVQVDETVIGKPLARWAIVAFIEAHGVEALSRTETHKWYKGDVA